MRDSMRDIAYYKDTKKGLLLTESYQKQGLIIGNRIPKDFFVTSGCGESDITTHAGSFHLALKQAGIERANIMTYSSILPGIANEIKKPKIVHGEVMETIMSVANGLSGERVTAGLIFSWLFNRKTNKKYGGLVSETFGNYEVTEIEDLLYNSLDELYINGFKEDYCLKNTRLITKSIIPEKKYGTALVALCFCSYLYPIN